MKYEEVIMQIKNLFPTDLETEVLENMVLQSSHITFEETGSTLFRKGDPPLGFYWILKGTVQESINGKAILTVGKGQMVGLEEFLEQTAHSSNWNTLAYTEALFIDRKCFGNLSNHSYTQNLISSQLAKQLLAYKKSFIPIAV